MAHSYSAYCIGARLSGILGRSEVEGMRRLARGQRRHADSGATNNAEVPGPIRLRSDGRKGDRRNVVWGLGHDSKKDDPAFGGHPLRKAISPKSLSNVSRVQFPARQRFRTSSSGAPGWSSLDLSTSNPAPRSTLTAESGKFSSARNFTQVLTGALFRRGAIRWRMLGRPGCRRL